MTTRQAMIRIILPQAFVVALPNLGNQLVQLLKATSLAFTIGVLEIMGISGSLQMTAISFRNLSRLCFDLLAAEHCL